MQQRHAEPLTDEKYQSAFKAFRDASDQRRLMVDWVDSHKEILLPKKDHAAVLSVGAGNGDFDLAILPSLRNRCASLAYTTVEPNMEMAREFEQRFTTSRVDGVTVHQHALKLEDFRTDDSYELIHFTQCLFHIPDRESAIRGALAWLSDSGVMFIMNSTEVGLQGIRDTFSKRVRGNLADFYTADRLRALLDSIGVSFQYEEIPSRIEVTDSMAYARAKGDPLLDFFLECSWDSIPDPLKVEITAYIEARLVEEQGRLYLPHPVGVLTIAKQ